MGKKKAHAGIRAAILSELIFNSTSLSYEFVLILDVHVKTHEEAYERMISSYPQLVKLALGVTKPDSNSSPLSSPRSLSSPSQPGKAGSPSKEATDDMTESYFKGKEKESDTETASSSDGPRDANQPIHMLAEARQHYGKRRAPFVCQNVSVDIYPGRDEEVTLDKGAGKDAVICQEWDESSIFWTYTQNGVRYIVMGFDQPSAYGGRIWYRIWRGPKEGFDENGVAFIHYYSRVDKAKYGAAGLLGDPRTLSEPKIPSKDPPRLTASGRRQSRYPQRYVHSDVAGIQSLEEPATRTERSRSLGGRQLSISPLGSERTNSPGVCRNSTSPSYIGDRSPSEFSIGIPQSRGRQVGPNTASTGPQGSRQVFVPSKRERSSSDDLYGATPRAARQPGVPAAPTRGSKKMAEGASTSAVRPDSALPDYCEGTSKNRRAAAVLWRSPNARVLAFEAGCTKCQYRQLQCVVADNSRCAYCTALGRKCSLSGSLAVSRGAAEVSALARAAAPASASAPSASDDHRDQSSSPSVIEIHNPYLFHSNLPNSDPTRETLSHQTPAPPHVPHSYQRARTTLHISISTNSYGAVPVYLSSCMTVKAFFASAATAWGLEGKEKEVAAVTVTFDWLEDRRPMVVREELPDSFQKILEIVEKAPCWKEKEEDARQCDVRVLVIMK